MFRSEDVADSSGSAAPASANGALSTANGSGSERLDAGGELKLDDVLRAVRAGGVELLELELRAQRDASLDSLLLVAKDAVQRAAESASPVRAVAADDVAHTDGGDANVLDAVVERELESEADVPALVQGTTQSKATELGSYVASPLQHQPGGGAGEDDRALSDAAAADDDDNDSVGTETDTLVYGAESSRIMNIYDAAVRSSSATRRSPLDAAKELLSMRQSGRVLRVLCLARSVTSPESRDQQWKTATDFVGSALEQLGCAGLKLPAELRSSLEGELPAHAKEVLHRLNSVPRPNVLRLEASADFTENRVRRTMRAVADVPCHDPSVVMVAALELHHLHPNRYEVRGRRPLAWCGAPGSFAASEFVTDLSTRARATFPALADPSIIIAPIEIAFDESQRNTFGLYIVRLRVRVFERHDPAEQAAMVMALPVDAAVRFQENGQRLQPRDVPPTTRRWLVSELQRQALTTLMQKLAALTGTVLTCRLGLDELRIAPVFAVATVDIPVRCMLAGIMARYSAKGAFGASHMHYYSYVVDVGGDDGAAAAPRVDADDVDDDDDGDYIPEEERPRKRAATAAARRTGTAATAAIFPSADMRRSEARDREIVRGLDPRNFGIDARAFTHSPLHVQNLRLLDLHDHLPTDGMHTFDGCLQTHYRLLEAVFGEKPLSNAARNQRVHFLGQKKGTLFVPIADRIRDASLLLAAVASLAATGVDPHHYVAARDPDFATNSVTALRMTAALLELLGSLTDPSPGLLLEHVDLLCATLVDVVEHELVQFPQRGTHQRYLTVKMALLLYSASHDLKRKGAHADTSTKVFETLNRESKQILTERGSNRADSHFTVVQVDMLRRAVQAYERLHESTKVGGVRPPPTALRVEFALVGRGRDAPVLCESEEHVERMVAELFKGVLLNVYGVSVTEERARDAVRAKGAARRLLDVVRRTTPEHADAGAPVMLGSALSCAARFGDSDVAVDLIRVPRSATRDRTLHAVAYVTPGVEPGVRDGAAQCGNALCLHHRGVEFAASRALLGTTSFGVPVAFAATERAHAAATERAYAALVLTFAVAPHPLREHFSAVGDFVEYRESVCQFAAMDAHALRGSRPLAPRTPESSAWYSNVSSRWLSTNL